MNYIPPEYKNHTLQGSLLIFALSKYTCNAAVQSDIKALRCLWAEGFTVMFEGRQFVQGKVSIFGRLCQDGMGTGLVIMVFVVKAGCIIISYLRLTNCSG